MSQRSVCEPGEGGGKGTRGYGGGGVWRGYGGMDQDENRLVAGRGTAPRVRPSN